jgi:hypothetical protein
MRSRAGVIAESFFLTEGNEGNEERQVNLYIAVLWTIATQFLLSKASPPEPLRFLRSLL